MTVQTRDTSLDPRKSPRQRRSEATVAAVLEAAARILESEGLEGYTTNAVAKRAGISIGSLYQYFSNKDSITRALIARETQALLAEVEKAASSSEGWEALEQIIVVAVGHQLGRPTLARLLDLEEQRLPVREDMERAGTRVASAIRRSLTGSHFDHVRCDPFAIPDLISIIKGLVDGAGARGERDKPALIGRVQKAVFGYLQR